MATTFGDQRVELAEPEAGAVVLEDALTNVLPAALVSSAEDARDAVPDGHESTAGSAVVLAAALGATAARPIAHALHSWFARRGEQLVGALPRWFQPAFDAEATPIVATQTEFSNGRNRFVRSVVESRTPVLISRRGSVVAALVPVVEGVFEQEAYAAAAREIRAERLQGRDPLLTVLDNLTDEDIEKIRSAKDKIKAAAFVGVDLTDVTIFEDWLASRANAGSQDEA